MSAKFGRLAHRGKGLQAEDLELNDVEVAANGLVQLDTLLANENDEDLHDAMHGSSHYLRSILQDPVLTNKEKLAKIKFFKRNGFVSRSSRAFQPMPKDRVPLITLEQRYSSRSKMYVSRNFGGQMA